MPITYDTIYFKRGLDANLPATANNGEPLWTTDTHRMFVGHGDGIKEIAGVEDLGYVTPEMFGAKRDGVTDDYIALQKALDTGSNVRLSEGIYACNTGLIIKSYGQRLLGQGKRKTTLARTTTNIIDYMIMIGEDRNILPTGQQDYPNGHLEGNAISGLAIKGSVTFIPSTRQTKYGIYVMNAQQYDISDCYIYDCYGGINIRGLYTPSYLGWYCNFRGNIDNNYIAYCEKFGIAMGFGVSQTYITRNCIEAIGPSSINYNAKAYGIHIISQSIGLTIRDNMIQVIGYRTYGSQATNKTAHGIGVSICGGVNVLMEGNYSESNEITYETADLIAEGFLNYPYPLTGNTDPQLYSYNVNININSNFVNGIQPLGVSLASTNGANVTNNNFGYYPQAAAGALWIGTGAEGHNNSGWVNGTWNATGMGVFKKAVTVTGVTFTGNVLTKVADHPESTWNENAWLDPAQQVHPNRVDGATEFSNDLYANQKVILNNNGVIRMTSNVAAQYPANTGTRVHTDIISGGAGPSSLIAFTGSAYYDNGFKYAENGINAVALMFEGNTQSWAFGYASGSGKSAGDAVVFANNIHFYPSDSVPNIAISNLKTGAGPESPEGVFTAPAGSTYMRTNGTFWLKKTGDYSTNTGWVQIA